MSTQDKRYFEDLVEGQTFDCGSVTVTKDEMLEFAERYDPQAIHLNEEAAGNSMFGDLIASGWLTCALTTRLLVEGYMNRNATLGGRGMDEIRWHKPVYAGSTLSVTVGDCRTCRKGYGQESGIWPHQGEDCNHQRTR